MNKCSYPDCAAPVVATTYPYGDLGHDYCIEHTRQALWTALEQQLPMGLWIHTGSAEIPPKPFNTF